MAKKPARRTASTGRRRGSSKGRRRTPSSKRGGARGRRAARSGAGTRRTDKAGRNTRRRTSRAKMPKGKAARKSKPLASKRAATRRAKAGAGFEETLAQTPETGRTVKGRTNPMPTRRSTGTPSGAGSTRRIPGLDRARRQLREIEENIPTPPSSLDMNRGASAARSGRAEMREARRDHTETSPVMTGGDVDADWEDAYAVGDETPGGDNPTPDQDRVDDIGKALGVEYQDTEELRAADKIAERDKKRWELDPASSEDYKDRD